MTGRIDRTRVVEMTLAGESAKQIAETLHITERSVTRIRAAKGVSVSQPLHTEPSSLPDVPADVQAAAVRILTRFGATDVLEALGIAS